MLKRCIFAEWRKLKHSHIWILLMGLPIISVLIGSANFIMNQNVLKNGWYSLWSQVGLFYVEFFFPILIAICCGFMWRLEHLNRNWNMIMTVPVSTINIFLSKLIVISVLLIFVQGFFILLYFLGGKVIGLTSSVPREIPGWLFRGWIAATTISTIQLALSMSIRSFAVPIGIGLCAVFIGLGMYITDLGFFFPHSLLTIGMGVLSQTSLLSSRNYFLFFIINLLYGLVIGAGAIRWMKKSDVIS